MCSSVVISTGFISEYIILSRSTTMLWKSAHITPVHKKGSKNSYGELPPNITDLYCMQDCWSRGKNPCGWLLVRSNLFDPDQFAYLRGKPTLAQLLTCYNDWAKARNRSQQTDIIFLDLSNAFHSVQHDRLLPKLQRHGIDGSLLLWIRNFLTNRRKGVVLRGNCSD